MNMRHIRTKLAATALLAILLLIGVVRAPASPHAEPGEPEVDRIDYDRGLATATGLSALSNQDAANPQAYLRARGAAKLDALRNLTMLIDHVEIDSETNGADYTVSNDNIRAKVKGIVNGAHVVDVRKKEMGKFVLIQVTVSAYLNSPPSRAAEAVPEKRHGYRTTETGPDMRTPEPMRPSRQVIPSVPVEPRREWRHPYTSLIIDARHLHLERSMSPKILRPDGREFWGTVDADPDYVIEHGIVSYARSLAEARDLERAGDNPLIVRSIGTEYGPYNSDVVISYEDLRRIQAAESHDHFLSNFHVIFVVGSNR